MSASTRCITRSKKKTVDPAPNPTRFIDYLPLLHFLKNQNAFSSPSPLLLASVLYISALHNPSAELASLAGGYFVAICSAIAELVIPSPLPDLFNPSSATLRSHDSSGNADEQRVFQDILGLIMASLCSEAYVESTDKWIAIAYRLLLDHCPTAADSTTQDWPGLFSGIQVRPSYQPIRDGSQRILHSPRDR